MRLEIDAGEVFSLGVTEDAPTIGIIDYSRRETDEFGVTTVVKRGFARRMSVRVGLPFDNVDAVQQKLAAYRATPALWIADDDIASLSVRGFYKDFELDLAVPPFSFCTLTVEGLALTDDLGDSGADPAPEGQDSTLRLLMPIDIVSGVVTTSNVPEADYPAWSALTTYAMGARVILGTHRIYESTIGGNAGHNPTAGTGEWMDIGPTNRWAMFDQALGTVTTNPGSIVVTFNVGDERSIALIDVVGTTVRMQAAGYDETVAVAPGTIVMSPLPSAPGVVTVTIEGPGDVSVGTLLLGTIVGLGLTEASPTAGITDYSRKEIDDFGEITIVQRAWAKRLAAKALIGTSGVDDVVSRFAAIRARPSLWIGDTGTDSLTIYGFWKDFSIEVGESVSKLSLSVEGLSLAAPAPQSLPDLIEEAGKTADWSKVVDDNGKKPEDNATFGMTSDEAAEVAALAADSAAANIAIADAVEQIGEIQTTITASIPDLQARILAAEGEILTLDTGLANATAGVSSLWTAVSNVEGDIANIDVRVAAAETTIETQQLAIDTIDAQVATITTDLSAGLADIALAATAITTLQGAQATLSSTVAAQGASISSLQTATTTLQGQAATLETRVSAAGNNLLENGSFENGLTGWSWNLAGWNSVSSNAGWGSWAYSNAAVPDGGYSVFYYVPLIPIAASIAYTASADVGQFNSTPGTSLHYVQIDWYQADGTTYITSIAGPARYSNVDFDATGQSRQTLKVTGTAPSNAAFARVLIVWYKGSGSVVSHHVRQVKFERGSAATRYSQEASVIQTYSALSTVTTNYASLSSTVSVQGVTVSSHSTAIATLSANDTALFGRYGVEIGVGGYWTGFVLNNNGSRGDANFDVDYFGVGKAGAGLTRPFQIIGSTTYLKNAQIQNAAIDTLKVAGNAITVPLIISSGGSHQGDGTYQEIASGGLTMSEPGVIFISTVIAQVYVATGVAFELRIKVNGTIFGSVGGGAVQVGVPCVAALPVGAGTHTISLEWFAPPSITMASNITFVQGAKR